MRDLRWREIAMVPQSSMDSLDPVYRLESQFLEVLSDRGGMNHSEARVRAGRALRSWSDWTTARLRNYPHEFSGGMKQRAVIAMALALHPSLVIADEPVTALDVIVQDQVLEVMRDLQERLGISVIMITHDMSVVAADVPGRGGDVCRAGGRERARCSTIFQPARSTPTRWA